MDGSESSRYSQYDPSQEAKWHREAIAITIERCAIEVDDRAKQLEAWSHQDHASRFAAEMLRKTAAAIRALPIILLMFGYFIEWLSH